MNLRSEDELEFILVEVGKPDGKAFFIVHHLHGYGGGIVWAVFVTNDRDVSDSGSP